MPYVDNENIQDVRLATLEARIDRVADATIRKKWKKQPTSAHGAARDALSIARQQARARRGKGRTSQTAEDCVDGMLDRLHDRLSRIPYPPATDESHFDYEANLNRASTLENQLSDNSNAMKLLRAQIVKEEGRLAAEEKELSILEKNATDEEKARRTRYSHLHPVAKDISENVDEGNNLSLNRHAVSNMQSEISLLYKESELLSTLEQLDNHLSSISQNTASTVPISRDVERARNELRAAIDT